MKYMKHGRHSRHQNGYGSGVLGGLRNACENLGVRISGGANATGLNVHSVYMNVDCEGRKYAEGIRLGGGGRKFDGETRNGSAGDLTAALLPRISSTSYYLLETCHTQEAGGLCQ